ncbi:MAG: hypothetical protein EOO96_16910 [Pedobacter sp.]|nr:MAG: hypothetical protein EOO96_16910 [Pedobacter sp.]
MGADEPIFSAYYEISEEGNWKEEQVNNPWIRKEKTIVAEDFKISLQEFEEIIKRSKQKLFDKRAERIRPGLDDKILTSWNALMLKGLCDAYKAIPSYVENRRATH